jgi:hypothetical protein
MSTVNEGEQTIVWKYTTPLRAEYLNKLIAGVTSPGLITRPKCTVVTASGTGSVTINPFQLFIEPHDKKATFVDEDGKNPIISLVKVYVEKPVTKIINTNTIAIGFTYSFSNAGNNQPIWYGDFVTLTASDMDSFDGVIVATVQHYLDSGTGITYYSVKTSGADISDALLVEEGWNPNCWISLISPRRINLEVGGTGCFNQLEVRSHNEQFAHYISGHAGCDMHSNLRYTFPTTDVNFDPTGERALKLPARYCAFNVNSEGFNLCDSSDTLPIEHVHGGILTVVDAQCSMAPVDNQTAFANNLNIKPNNQEKINCFFSEGTMYVL